jgi:hypothetical protein
MVCGENQVFDGSPILQHPGKRLGFVDGIEGGPLEVIDRSDAEHIAIPEILADLNGDLEVAIDCALALEEFQNEKAALAADHLNFPSSRGSTMRFWSTPVGLDAFGKAHDTGLVEIAARIVLGRAKRRER